MRTAKPWYRSANDTWYVWHRGQQIPLAKGKRSKRDAEAAFHQLMAAIPTPSEAGSQTPSPVEAIGQSLLVAELLDQFLDWVKFNLDCFDLYQQVLQKFALGCGQLTIAELKPIHVSNWLSKKTTWGPTTRNRIIGIIKRAFNWAVDQGLLDQNPLRRLKKPPSLRRERILSPEEREKMLAAASDQAFRDLLIALQDTGARPGEIRQVTAANVHLDHGVWVLCCDRPSRGSGQTPRHTLCRNGVRRSVLDHRWFKDCGHSRRQRS